MTTLVLLALALAVGHAPEGTPELRISWQRNLPDAEALSRASGKPLLVCVNMDGEVACESFANRKYKDPVFIALTEGFVPVIASPVRHNKVDHDPQGRRVPCPRFGQVTCGEHMRIEAPVYERYFGGQRYAPRHVGVRLAPAAGATIAAGATGSADDILFDRFLDVDLRRVDEALAAHGVSGALLATSSGLSLTERCDAVGRSELEAAYLAADRAGRRALLEACARASVTQGELIRLGLYESDAELRQLAAAALANASQAPDLELVLAALAHEEDLARRERLAARLATRADKDPRAARELKVNLVLQAQPEVDVDGWLAVFQGADDASGTLEESWQLETRLEKLLGLRDLEGQDAQRSLGVARCYLGLARWGLAEGKGPGFFLQDADDSALRADELGADEADVAAVRSQVAWLQFRQQEAGDLAQRALRGLAGDADRREAFAQLSVLAASRTRSIQEGGVDWPEAWATEALAAYRAIEACSASTAAQWASHIDLLTALNLKSRRDRVLDQGLERFPVAPELHERLRAAILEQRGMAGLEEAYVERRAQAPDRAGHDWFTGYATLIVAEDQRRAKRWDDAQVTYERAKEHFGRSAGANSDYEASCRHFEAMALAGQAQAALENDQLETAVVRICDAVRLRPESLEAQDGLQRTPLDVLNAVAAAVRAPDQADLMARLASLERTAPDVWQRVN